MLWFPFWLCFASSHPALSSFWVCAAWHILVWEEAGKSFSESHLDVGNKQVRDLILFPWPEGWIEPNDPTFPFFCILLLVSSLSHILCIIFSVEWEELEGISEELSSWESSSFCFVKMHWETHSLGLSPPPEHTRQTFFFKNPLTSSVELLLIFPDVAKGFIL